MVIFPVIYNILYHKLRYKIYVFFDILSGENYLLMLLIASSPSTLAVVLISSHHSPRLPSRLILRLDFRLRLCFVGFVLFYVISYWILIFWHFIFDIVSCFFASYACRRLNLVSSFARLPSRLILRLDFRLRLAPSASYYYIISYWIILIK
jgi:hypothetical protein